MVKNITSRGDHLIWLDMEMSGLDPLICRPLEIATIVTDNHLNVLAEGPNLVIHQADALLEAMDDWNTQHHTESGLVQQVQQSRLSEAEAESMTLAFISQFVEPGRGLLAGNTIGQDRRFLRRYMPDFERYLHYRSLDISSIKELSRRWFGIEPPSKKTAHRALDDIRESIEELRYYRDNVFRLDLFHGDD